MEYVKPYNGSIVRIIETQLSIIFTGAYLSFFFILSHNFKDVNNDKIQSSLSFMKHQIISSCNFDSTFFTYINGGLNYQIEHHLFPRYHHSKYKELSVIVKNNAYKHNYSYTQFSSLYNNFKSNILHLYLLGK
jgi:fatty acid desaturase (delta-4 desaturase)